MTDEVLVHLNVKDQNVELICDSKLRVYEVLEDVAQYTKAMGKNELSEAVEDVGNWFSQNSINVIGNYNFAGVWHGILVGLDFKHTHWVNFDIRPYTESIPT